VSPPAKLLLVLCVAVGVIGGVVLVIVAAARAAARKRAELMAAADRLGLAYLPKGDKAFVKAWSVVKPLSKSGSASHVVYGTLPSGLMLTAFEHQYAVSTGKSVHVVTHAVFAVETPDWPQVTLQRRGMVSKWFLDLIGRTELDDDQDADGPPGLARTRAVTPEDAAFADHLLSAPGRAVIDGAEKAPWWWFAGGKMTVLIGSALSPDVLDRGVALVEEAVHALPADLQQAVRSPMTEPSPEEPGD